MSIRVSAMGSFLFAREPRHVDIHPDFEPVMPMSCGLSGCNGPLPQMVAPTLDTDKKPVLMGNGPIVDAFGITHVKDAASFRQWFRNVEGVNQWKDVDLTLEARSALLNSFGSDPFFPIDGQLFGNQGIADQICVIRSMHAEQINHDPAHAFMNTGSILKNRPSMGSWFLYGLGAEADNLPGYVVMVSTGRSGDQPISSRQWSAGFLPSRIQGIQFQSRGDAVHCVKSPQGVDADNQRQVIEAVRRLDRAPSSAAKIPRSTPGSASTRWPLPCRPQYPS